MHVFYQNLVIYMLTPILLNTTTLTFANSVDPDQMAPEYGIWSGPILFAIHFANPNEYIISNYTIGW